MLFRSYDREKLQERLAKLAGGVAVINVGAATETEMKEKKARVEDALHATRAAVEEGIVAGGGVALLRTAKAIDSVKLEGDEAIGAQIVRRAIEAPIRMLCSNAGVEEIGIFDHTFMQTSHGLVHERKDKTINQRRVCSRRIAILDGLACFVVGVETSLRLRAELAFSNFLPQKIGRCYGKNFRQYRGHMQRDVETDTVRQLDRSDRHAK